MRGAAAAVLSLCCFVLPVQAQPVQSSGGLSATTVKERGETAEVQGARFTVSVSRSEQGNLALIANNSDHVVKITSNHGMETSLASRQSASWACRPGSFVASLVIATEEGGFIASPELRCGEALYLTEGE